MNSIAEDGARMLAEGRRMVREAGIARGGALDPGFRRRWEEAAARRGTLSMGLADAITDSAPGRGRAARMAMMAAVHELLAGDPALGRMNRELAGIAEAAERAPQERKEAAMRDWRAEVEDEARRTGA